MLKLKELQKNSEYTIEENAKRLNMPKSTYNNYLIESRQPDIQTLIKLANYFDVSLDYLCERDNQSQIGYVPTDRIDLIKYLIKAPYSVINQVEVFLKGYISGKSEQQQVNFYTPDEI